MILTRVFTLLCFAAGTVAPAAVPSASEILRKSDDARAPEGTFSCLVTAADHDGDGKPRETTYRVYSKGLDLTLIETLAPERMKGRKLLMRGTDLWLYLPNVKRPTRVGFQQRLTGEVSNGDIARTNFSKDYDPELVGTEDWKGTKAYKLLLKAKHKDVTYRSVQYWVGTGDFRPLKAEFFALSGKLLKTGEYLETGAVFGKPRITKVQITDALSPKKQSVLTYSAYRWEKLDDAFFNKESLAE